MSDDDLITIPEKKTAWADDEREHRTDSGAKQFAPATPGLPNPEQPEWLLGIQPGTRLTLAGWWFRVEQAVTNGEGQWAVILTPQEPTAATKFKKRAGGKRARG